MKISFKTNSGMEHEKSEAIVSGKLSYVPSSTVYMYCTIIRNTPGNERRTSSHTSQASLLFSFCCNKIQYLTTYHLHLLCYVSRNLQGVLQR
jgi:hypothetical protein